MTEIERHPTAIVGTAELVALDVRADDKQAAFSVHDNGSIDATKDDRPAESAQGGVQKIEAVTLTWSKSSVFMLLVLYAAIEATLAREPLLINTPQDLVPDSGE